MTTTRIDWITSALCLSAFIVTTPRLGAGQSRTIAPDDARLLRERPDAPYLAPDPAAGRSTPARAALLGGAAPMQANVDALGLNILNDAANEPSLAVDPVAPNRIAIGWRQFDNVQSSFRQAGWGYSNDGGRTWTFPGVIEPGVFRSDPVLDFDSNGNFYYNSLSVVGNDFTCQVYTSTDGGATWGPSVYAFGGDKQWMTVDRTGGLGEGNIYHSWSPAAACCGEDLWSRSIDGGASFQTPVAFPDPPRFGTLDIGPNGEQYTVGIQSVPFDSSRHLFVSSSNAQDAGATPTFDLTTTVDLGGETGFGGVNPAGLLGQVSVGADRSGGARDGFIYMLGSVVPTSGLDPLDVHFVRSEDGGATWSAPVRVNDDPVNSERWQWFGTMAVAPNGRVDVIWNDTRADATASTSQLYYASSSDGGVSWSPNAALTVPFNHSLGYPQQEKLGDYYDMVSDDVGAHVAFAATFNGEQDVFYLRINDYDCNGNGVGDAQDLTAGGADCNTNGILDSCEIAAGAAADVNDNGVPDTCECIADLDGSGDVGFGDLVLVLSKWGPCPDCPEDIDANDDVGFSDLLLVLGAWGPCS